MLNKYFYYACEYVPFQLTFHYKDRGYVKFFIASFLKIIYLGASANSQVIVDVYSVSASAVPAKTFN